MVLVQKWPFFQLFFEANVSQENVFYDNLERKNAFLGYKNKKFKKSKNSHFSKRVKVVLYKKNAIFMRNCLKIFLLVFTSFMIQFFGGIVFLSIFCSYIVINCNFERSVTWFPWQRVCLRVVLGLKSALKLVESALNEVFWPRHIP